MKYPILRFGATMALVLLLAVPAFAGRGKKDRKDPKYAADKSWRAPLPMHTLSIRVIGGMLVGPISDRIEQYSSDVKQKLIHGWGLGFERSFKNRYSIGINLDHSTWGVPDWDRDANIRSIYASWLYRFRPLKKSSLYFGFNYGWVDIWAVGKSRVYNIGSYPFVKFSLGQLFRTTESNDGRFGLYYKVIFSKDDSIRYFGDVDFNTCYFGVECSLGRGF